MTVTLMGGDMQAQGIAQVLLNVLELGANVQAATDMARFRHMQVANVLTLESRCSHWSAGQLRAMGHDVRSVNGEDMGGYQAIMFTPDTAGSAATGSGSPIRGTIAPDRITARTARRWGFEQEGDRPQATGSEDDGDRMKEWLKIAAALAVVAAVQPQLSSQAKARRPRARVFTSSIAAC